MPDPVTPEPVWDGTGVDPWMPARLDGALDAATAERDVYRGVWAELSAWLVTASRRVLATARPDPAAVWSLAPDWARRVTRVVDGPIRGAMSRAYRRLLGDDYPIDSRPAVATHLAETTNRLVGVPDDVYDLIAGDIARGAAAGESIPRIADTVAETLSTTASPRWPDRAVTIARTETMAALNAGRADSFDAVADLDPDTGYERMWLATLDARTRPTHRAADTQRVPLGQPFTVGAATLRYPGDPTGPPHETINCRCTLLLLAAGEDVDLSARPVRDQ